MCTECAGRMHAADREEGIQRRECWCREPVFRASSGKQVRADAATLAEAKETAARLTRLTGTTVRACGRCATLLERRSGCDFVRCAVCRLGVCWRCGQTVPGEREMNAHHWCDGDGDGDDDGDHDDRPEWSRLARTGRRVWRVLTGLRFFWALMVGFVCIEAARLWMSGQLWRQER